MFRTSESMKRLMVLVIFVNSAATAVFGGAKRTKDLRFGYPVAFQPEAEDV